MRRSLSRIAPNWLEEQETCRPVGGDFPTYAYPVIGNLPVQAIDTNLVLNVLEPVWHTKTETASRVRGRMESILDWATVRKYRVGENPARWKGHLDKLLPQRSRVRAVVHHAALPYSDAPQFIARLRQLHSFSARGLEFAILTAARTGEVIGATWNEFDLRAGVWAIPASRMKAKREHRVPLSDAANSVLMELKEFTDGDFVFQGGRQGRPLSNMAFLQLLKRLNRSDLTVHGFRSTFRDWAAERTDHSHEVIEMALAHTISNKVEAAYRRGDLFEKRRVLLQDWAAFLGPVNLPEVASPSGRFSARRPSGQASREFPHRRSAPKSGLLSEASELSTRPPRPRSRRNP